MRRIAREKGHERIEIFVVDSGLAAKEVLYNLLGREGWDGMRRCAHLDSDGKRLDLEYKVIDTMV